MKVLSALLILFALGGTAFAEDNRRSISVSGKSEISLEAQYAKIRIQIKHVRGTMDEGYRETKETLAAVIDKLKQFGITDQEIIKSSLTQGEEFDWINSLRKHSGYFSAYHIELRVNDLSKLPLIFEELSKQNSLSILSTEYGRNDAFETRNKEFTKALQAAKKKAALMAKSLDADIGPVISINEISPSDVRTLNTYSNDISDGSRGGTLGMVNISAAVTVEFALK